MKPPTSRRALLGWGALAAGLAAAGLFGHRRGLPPATSPADPALRAPEAPIPAGPLRILALGTSLTARGPWPAELQALLAPVRPGTRVEVLARAGANGAWGADALESRLARAPAPAVVLVEFAINDASLAHGLPRSTARATQARILAAARRAGAVPALMTMMQPFGREAGERPGLESYHADVRRLAADAGAGLVDAAPGWAALDRATRHRLAPDGLHPTAEAWQRLLLPLLGQLLAAPG